MPAHKVPRREIPDNHWELYGPAKTTAGTGLLTPQTDASLWFNSMVRG